LNIQNLLTPAVVIQEHQGTQNISAISSVDSPYHRLHPEMNQFFKELVSELVLLNSSGKSETMITIASPHLQTSPLYGMQILITEYSSAPKSFNVELYASPTALALVAPHIKEFTSTFDKNKFAFDIHRLELYHQEKEPLLKKVESLLSDDEKSET
jgi:hypothetical protein